MRLRAPVLDDAPAVLAVLLAREIADLGVPDDTLGDVLDEWRSSDLDLAADARVVENARDGAIIGYVVSRRTGTLAVVHPDHERRGIGRRLLEWAEQRERERGRESHRQWVAANNARARDLLNSAGCGIARSYWRLVRSLDDLGGTVAAPPPGFHLRTVDVARDAASIHAVDARSFAANSSYDAETLREFCEEHLEAHDFDASLSRVAETGESIAGFLIARRWTEEKVGYVDLLAVDPEHQGRGLGTALLGSAFASFASAGLGEAQLGVDSDNPRALRVYQRAGMRVSFQYDVYERPLSPPSRWRSYRDVDAAVDPASLARQLEGIATVPFVATEKERSLSLLELGAGGSVLDVGCGTGPELARLAEIVGHSGRVVGLDRSEALLAAARQRGLGALEVVELLEGDGVALPFADDEFDACRADRTLQHLASPEAALAEMVRVTRPRGRVVVTESRWGLVAPGLDQQVTDAMLGTIVTGTERAGWVGYRLPAMFEQAGLSSVESSSNDHTVGELDEFFRFTQLDALSGDRAREWLADLSDLLARGEAFAMVLVLHVVGEKPA
jgi:mycothiol synthase